MYRLLLCLLLAQSTPLFAPSPESPTDKSVHLLKKLKKAQEKLDRIMQIDAQNYHVERTVFDASWQAVILAIEPYFERSEKPECPDVQRLKGKAYLAIQSFLKLVKRSSEDKDVSRLLLGFQHIYLENQEKLLRQEQKSLSPVSRPQA